jgi:RNA polymerase sigma factor (sigma-70 family)
LPIDEGSYAVAIEVSDTDADELAALDDALDRLERTNARQSQVVECRFFGGLTIEETASALGIAAATVKRDWTLARAWLYRELRE